MASSSRASDRFPSQSKEELVTNLFNLKNQIQASRSMSIKEKLEKNKEELRACTTQRFESASRTGPEAGNLLSYRSRNPHCEIRGWEPSEEPAEMESINVQEVIPSESLVVVQSSNGGGRSSVPLVKLPSVEKLPSYTTWIFLDK